MNEPAGPRPGRETESASFDVARIGRGGRGWQPAVIVVFVVVLAAMVAVGVGGRASPTATTQPDVAIASSATSLPETPRAAASPGVLPRAAGTEPPALVTIGDQITLKVHRYATAIFVHGDVFVAKATWVFVSLEDSTGQVGGWSSVSIPGGAGPGVGSAPTLRFDVEVATPPELLDEAVWVQATAYDGTGTVIGSARIGVSPDGSVVDGPRSQPFAPRPS